MRVHYLQHVIYEELGYIGQWLDNGKHMVSATKLFQESATFPAQDTFDMLIVLGGPMGTEQHEIYPWLVYEKEFIRRSIENDKVVLGICLGAQLIASCLGGKVIAAPNKEIGWFPVTPNHKCSSSAWFHKLFSACPTVFHWHGDRFEIPQGGGCNLVSSQANTNQAFAMGKKILGLQFHLEATPTSIQLMLENGEKELQAERYVQSKGDILDGMVNINANNQLMAKIQEYLFAQIR